MIRRRLLATLLVASVASLLAPLLAAQTSPQLGDDIYRPSVGQSGKDVVWVPTPDALVTRMLQAARVTDKDLVYDLGSGDGKIPIAAAKQYGATAVGIEYNPDMAALATRNVERAGVASKVTIIPGDIFKEDFTKATVVTMYLLPDLNLKLRPMLLKMKPGTRITSHQFTMGEWEPDETHQIESRDAYLWIVPTDVAGRWTLREDQGAWQGEINLTQRFQRIGGTLTIRGRMQPLLGAFVNGNDVGFTFIDPDQGLRNFRATINGKTMAGSLRFGGHLTSVTGERL